MGRIEKTVFVSYRRADESWALAIFQDLTQHGYDVFIDYGGIASGNFEAVILENIRARAHFLVLLTPTALDRRADAKDWMRLEIEAALESQRNIVPLMLAGFDFRTPATASQLTGKLVALKEYNGLKIPEAQFFSSQMERLRNRFLNMPVQAVLHPSSLSAQQAATEQKDKATMALGEALQQPWLSPQEPRKQEETAAQRHRAEEERRRQEKLQEEARQRAEERRRQEAENKRRLDEAEAEKRRREEDERGRGLSSMPDEALSPLFFPQPAYALVIGITKYGHSQEPDDDKKLEANNFRNLKFAAKDAENFFDFLITHGFIPDNVTPLYNEHATRANIRSAFKKLMAACKAPDAKQPLVIVYFSGHGWADDDDKCYLVPHEAQRDQLFETAIAHQEFNSLLEEVSTNKLVVFLDACHAGAFGGVETEGAKGEAAGAKKYDFRGLGGGASQIVIASCSRGQNSYESDGNGIFTQTLLDLLRGGSPHFTEHEEIDTLDLYKWLREEVYRASGHRQEPQISRATGTGIVLAINQRARERRERREKEGRDKKSDFLAAVVEHYMKSRAGPFSTVARCVRNYAERGERLDGFDMVYHTFDEHLNDWIPGADAIVTRCCSYLMQDYEEATATLRSKLKVSVQEISRPLDRLDAPRKSLLVSPPSPKGTAAMPPAVLAAVRGSDSSD